MRGALGNWVNLGTPRLKVPLAGRKGRGGHRGGGKEGPEGRRRRRSIKGPGQPGRPPLRAPWRRRASGQDALRRCGELSPAPDPALSCIRGEDRAPSARPSSPSTGRLSPARHERRAGARGFSAVMRRWTGSGNWATAAPRAPPGAAPPG
ncbi:unnamed protein product [Rangifer tarandus platyrhynchus]|uniref:Uncharacterized protein n=2 Tax=Rangifer tarandus platyrhynchus TaxID=3082113 RepID=A0ABN8Y046_RANTA|nr:unnamed protein product [Rangifer tarandus platyrhynchus]CAI9713568.1 unnamed protein product [Rangifer tarandus platyrhynchus]